ncbi:hypothetical protein EDD57_10960 [Baia soyae]|uniref:Uncharacterized protein n=1 Tax=Baia soyae TaxID=1544746 RepID=A0A4R2S2B3_9BACL|nr:hypothetical protein EDD57_10960 [Baia soyae]
MGRYRHRGDLLIWADGKFSFMINKNRKRLIDNITDVNWYLMRVIPVIRSLDLYISEYTMEEIY